MFNETLDAADAAATVGVLVFGLLLVVASVVPGANLIAWSLIGAALEFVLTATPAVIRAEEDTAFWDEVLCILFCERPAANYPTDSWQLLVAAQFDGISGYPLSRTLARDMFNILELEHLQAAAWLATQSPDASSCVGCDCGWSYSWLGGGGAPPGWVAIAPTSRYDVAEDKFYGTEGASGNWAFHIRVPLPTGTDVRRLAWRLVTGEVVNGWALYLRNQGSVVAITSGVTRPAGLYEDQLVGAWVADEINFYCNSTTSTCEVDLLELSGRGTPPFP